MMVSLSKLVEILRTWSPFPNVTRVDFNIIKDNSSRGSVEPACVFNARGDFVAWREADKREFVGDLGGVGGGECTDIRDEVGVRGVARTRGVFGAATSPL